MPAADHTLYGPVNKKGCGFPKSKASRRRPLLASALQVENRDFRTHIEANSKKVAYATADV
jgi:hypothetical protein